MSPAREPRAPPWYLPEVRAASAFAAVLGLALAACAAGDDPGYFGTTTRAGKDPRTYYVNVFQEPEQVDPGLVSDWSSGSFVLQMFEGLTTYDPRDGHVVQGVATHWEQSADNRVYRFHLRPDARWSDGAPVTAHDFEYAWKRVLHPKTASRAAPSLYPLKHGEAFHQGKVRVLRSDVVLRARPDGGAPAAGALPRGAVVALAGPAESGFAPIAQELAPPTYAAAPAPAPAGPPLGWAPAAELVEDDAVIGVRAAGDHVLEVELEQPAPYFLDLTGTAALAPVRRDVIEAFERRGALDRWVRPGNIVVNGPYTLDAWSFRYEITMKRNPHWWAKDTLRIDRIVWLAVDHQHATMNLYKTGEIDYLGDNAQLPIEYASVLRDKKDFRTYPWFGALWYVLNVRKPPLDDARVRRALNLAIDKRELHERILGGAQPPATHYVPDYTGWGYADQVARDREAGVDPFPGTAFDPARARALLAEAGHPVSEVSGGFRARAFPPLEILYNTAEEHRAVAVAIQDMWKRHLGISVTLRNEEWKVMLKTIRDGHFQIARLGWVADYNHPHTWMSAFQSGSPQNSSGWSDPTFDALVREAARTADPAESIRLYRAAERRALDAMPAIPLYYRARSTLVKPWVKGFYPTPRDTHLARWLWIDPDWRDHPDNAPATPPLEFPAPTWLEGQ